MLRTMEILVNLKLAAHGWVTVILGRWISFSKLYSKAMQDNLAALEQETVRLCGGK